MPSIQTDIEIAADAGRVWELLSDLAGYPRWNASIVQLDGALAVGAPLRLRARLPGGIGIASRPVLSCVTMFRELSWRASLIHPRVFSAEHRFILEPLPGGVRLCQREDFHGWFSSFFIVLFARGLRRSYTQANVRLKQLAEKRASS